MHDTDITYKNIKNQRYHLVPRTMDTAQRISSDLGAVSRTALWQDIEGRGNDGIRKYHFSDRRRHWDANVQSTASTERFKQRIAARIFTCIGHRCR